MVQNVQALEPRDLLPPLLACLSTACASSRPPPSLLPLLSPILRQRVRLLSLTSSDSDAWLPLLCWDPTQASKVAEIVENVTIEPHPVSGEFEYGDQGVQYRRIDQEDLHAKVVLPDLGITVIYLWCHGDEEDGGTGWRVSELNPIFSTPAAGPGHWWNMISEAEAEFNKAMSIRTRGSETTLMPNGVTRGQNEGEEVPDDDDYWAQYDNTPGRTPAMNHSPAPVGEQNVNGHGSAVSEAEYYAQYAHVQPAMDNHDPSEEQADIGASSLNGEVLTASTAMASGQTNDSIAGSVLGGHSFANSIIHTRPSSPSSTSDTVARLESSAVSQSHAEIAIQQHISTSLKSLFRLARGTGIEREEFERLVRTELDTLSLITEDD